MLSHFVLVIAGLLVKGLRPGPRRADRAVTMARSALRPPSRRRLRRAHLPRSVEGLQARIGRLALARERLRDLGAPAEALERNRLEIVRAQWELSYALVERYCPPAHVAA
jgi:hypothetical protein